MDIAQLQTVLVVFLVVMLVVLYASSTKKETFTADETVGIYVPNPAAVEKQVHERLSNVMDTANWLACLPVIMIIDFLKNEIAKQNVNKVHCSVIHAKIAELKNAYDARVTAAKVSATMRTKLRNYLAKAIDTVEAIVNPMCAATSQSDQPFFVSVQELLEGLQNIQAGYCPSTIGSGSNVYSFGTDMKMSLPSFQYPVTVVATVSKIGSTAATPKPVVSANPRDASAIVTMSGKVAGKPVTVNYQFRKNVIVAPAMPSVNVGDKVVLKLTNDKNRSVVAIMPYETQVVAAVLKADSIAGKRRRLTVQYLHGLKELGEERTYVQQCHVHENDGVSSKQIAVHVYNHNSSVSGVAVKDVAKTLVVSQGQTTATFEKYGVFRVPPKKTIVKNKAYTVLISPQNASIRDVFA